MELILTVFQIVAPVFILAAIGFTWVKIGWSYEIEFVTRLAMTLSVPALIFVALMKANISADTLSNLFLSSLIAYLFLALIFWITGKIFKLNMATYWAPLIFGNTGNLGLPLAMFAFGEVGLGYAVVVFAVMAIGSFSIGVWMVSGGGSINKVFKEPMVWATLLGALFLIQGWQTPKWATNTLELLGQMAIPLMLITLGVALARLKMNLISRAIILSILKLCVSVGVAWIIGIYFELNDIAFAVLVMQIATPVAVTSYLLAQKYGADANEVAGLVIASTALSVFALPVLLGILL
jgi:predicted permease|tara:strand:+ start:772 stop:1653 length:882 start_codon:yes stop_codon:yes gene_type:complete